MPNRAFNHILNAVTSPSFYNVYVNLPNEESQLDSYILDNPKFFPYLEGALGALDGTHINA